MAGPGPGKCNRTGKQSLALTFDDLVLAPPGASGNRRGHFYLGNSVRLFSLDRAATCGAGNGMDWLLPLLLAIFGPGLVQTIVPGAAPAGGLPGINVPLDPLGA